MTPGLHTPFGLWCDHLIDHQNVECCIGCSVYFHPLPAPFGRADTCALIHGARPRAHHRPPQASRLSRWRKIEITGLRISEATVEEGGRECDR